MKKLIIIFSILLVSISMSARNSNISSVFIGMPDDLLFGVSPEQRAELVIPSDSVRVIVETDIKEKIERTALTEDYIALKTSEIGTLEIKLLSLVNNTDIIGVITTVCGPACDSKIDFYTTSWQRLDQDDLFPSKTKDWFLTNNTDGITDVNAKANISAILDMTPVKLSFSPDNNDIKVEYDIKKYVSSDDYQILKPFLIKDPVILKWDKLSYKR